MTLDGATLQHIGSFLAGLVTVCSTIIGVWKRRPIAAWWRSNRYLDGALRAERKTSAENAKRATDSEALVVELEQARDSKQSRLDDLTARMELVEGTVRPLQAKVDAFVDWARLLLDHIAHVESAAKAGGVDLRDHHVPRVPAILADKFGVPETLQGPQ